MRTPSGQIQIWCAGIWRVTQNILELLEVFKDVCYSSKKTTIFFNFLSKIAQTFSRLLSTSLPYVLTSTAFFLFFKEKKTLVPVCFDESATVLMKLDSPKNSFYKLIYITHTHRQYSMCVYLIANLFWSIQMSTFRVAIITFIECCFLFI